MRRNCLSLNTTKSNKTFEPNPTRTTTPLLPLLLALLTLLATPHAHAIDPHTNPGQIAAFSEFFGEYGAYLDDLRKFHSGPKNANESNHYFQMWDGQELPSLVKWAGLTNSHTLFVNSHGKAINTNGAQPGHAYYPHDSLIADPKSPPCYSAKDFATILGADASKIHNVVLAGCDLQSSFRAAEIRKHFVNATNIVHIPAGEAGYQPMFLQSFLSPSQDIKPLYESAQINAMGIKEYHIKTKPSGRAKRLSPYIAELYLPGATSPYRIQQAGRELLESPQPQLNLIASTSHNIPFHAPQR